MGSFVGVFMDGCNLRDVFVRGGLTCGQWLRLPWHGGPILVTFEVVCVWLD